MTGAGVRVGAIVVVAGALAASGAFWILDIMLPLSCPSAQKNIHPRFSEIA